MDLFLAVFLILIIVLYSVIIGFLVMLTVKSRISFH